MSKWTKEQLENMLEDVVNELDLSEGMIEKHGQVGTAPSELVRLVIEDKDRQIAALKAGLKQIYLPIRRRGKTKIDASNNLTGLSKTTKAGIWKIYKQQN